MKKNQNNNKTLSFKDYVAKYIFLKILYGEYKVNSYIPSESSMAKYFNTTNLTIRTAYNVLISLGILKPIKGKGYLIRKNSLLVLWSTYELLEGFETEIKIIDDLEYKITFTNEKEDIVITSEFVTKQKIQINETNPVLSIFRTILHLDVFIDFDILTKYDIKSINNTFFLIEKTSLINNADGKEILSIKTHINKKDLQHYTSFRTLKI